MPLPARLSASLATGIVFGTSFCVLVLEILAGRLLAPIIGVSLETFTGIIGTVLAGIALGNAAGGRLADRRDPAALLGPAILLGGLTTWLAPLLVSAIGPARAVDPVSIVFLTAITFFAPAAVLSSVSPMVAKLSLADLGDTGRIVGNLSAAGTVGALVGTFLTGFVLVAAFPTRSLLFAVGLLLVLAGLALTGWERLSSVSVLLLLGPVLGLGALLLRSPCDAETAYACVEVVPDPDRAGGLSLVLNGARNSYVDLDDPSYLDFRYMRLFADVSDTLAPGPVEALHLGGAGFTFPRYLNADRPGSTSMVLEIDEELVQFSQDRLGLVVDEDLVVVTGDARLSIAALPDDGYDIIVGDAFSGLTIPWHLTTTQFVDELDRVLRADGLVVANLIDGGDAAFVRAAMATYATRFEHVALIVAPGGFDQPDARNFILIASHRAISAPVVDVADGSYLPAAQAAGLIGDVRPLDDDFAPVDQLRQAR